MFDDLAAYFYENVVTAYQEYAESRKNPSAGKSHDLRLAINAATSLYHLREHIPQPLRKTRSQLARQCPDYDLLGDAVNAAKHRKLTQGNPKIVSADDISEELLLTEYKDEKGAYYHVEKALPVHLVDGSTRDLHEVMTSVLNMWFDELYSSGVISKTKHFSFGQIGIPPRSSEGGAFPLNLEILPGVRFHQTIRLRRYNYDTNAIEPVDLTGWDARMRIYKPAYSLDIVLRHDETEEAVKRTFDLTDEESLEFHKLETDEQREAFVASLAEKRDFMAEILRQAKHSEDE